MKNEEKIQELLNNYPINKAICSPDELSAYRQGLLFGANAIAEWKEEELINNAKEFIAEHLYEHPHCTNHICCDDFNGDEETDVIDVFMDELEKKMLEY